MRVRRDVFSGRLKLNGLEHEMTLGAANNCAHSLVSLLRFEEAREVLRSTFPVARRVLGESNELTLQMRLLYAAIYLDDGATLDDLHEAVTTLEEGARIARRVLGGAHPLTVQLELSLRDARAALRARETPPGRVS